MLYSGYSRPKNRERPCGVMIKSWKVRLLCQSLTKILSFKDYKLNQVEKVKMKSDLNNQTSLALYRFNHIIRLNSSNEQSISRTN